MAENRNIADDPTFSYALKSFGLGLNRGYNEYVGQARKDPNKFINDYGMEAAELYGADAPGLTPILAMNKSLDEQRQRARRRSRTILTGGQGLLEPAPVARRQLLG